MASALYSLRMSWAAAATGDGNGVNSGRKELWTEAWLLSAPFKAPPSLTVSAPAGQDAHAGESSRRMSFLLRRSHVPACLRACMRSQNTLPTHCACLRVTPALAPSLLDVLLSQTLNAAGC